MNEPFSPFLIDGTSQVTLLLDVRFEPFPHFSFDGHHRLSCR